eukprot:PhF_6_TR8066/c0_g1_i1/m.12479
MSYIFFQVCLIMWYAVAAEYVNVLRTYSTFQSDNWSGLTQNLFRKRLASIITVPEGNIQLFLTLLTQPTDQGENSYVDILLPTTTDLPAAKSTIEAAMTTTLADFNVTLVQYAQREAPQTPSPPAPDAPAADDYGGLGFIEVFVIIIVVLFVLGMAACFIRSRRNRESDLDGKDERFEFRKKIEEKLIPEKDSAEMVSPKDKQGDESPTEFPARRASFAERRPSISQEGQRRASFIRMDD